MRFLNVVIAFTVGSVLGVGCADRERLVEMHDATGEMNNTTKNMDGKVGQTNERLGNMLDTTSRMEKSTVELEKKTGDVVLLTEGLSTKTDNMIGKMDGLFGLTRSTFIRLRQGSSRDLRRGELEQLIKSPTMDGKFTHAVAYFFGMEYQLGDDNAIDSAELRDNMMASGVEEFLFKMADFMPADESMPLLELHLPDEPPSAAEEMKRSLRAYGTDGLEADNDVKSGYALAAAAHMFNTDSAALFKEKGLEPLSMLDLIYRGLSQEKKINDSTDGALMGKTPGYVAKVLTLRKHAIFLLQMRLNVLTSLLVKKLSKLADAKSTNEKATAQVMLAMGAWNMEIDNHNAYSRRELAMVAAEAIKAYDFLNTEVRGTKPRLNSLLKRSISNMNLPDAAALAKSNNNLDRMTLALVGQVAKLKGRVASESK